MRFSRYNQPKRKRVKKPYDYNDRMISATKEMLADQKLGYEVPKEFYEEKYDLKR